MRSASLFAILAMMNPTMAFAEGGKLYGFSGSDIAFVWKSKADLDEATALLRADVHLSKPELFDRLLACAVASGTDAVVTRRDRGSLTVVVVDGEFTGCRGTVPNGNFKSDDR